ncbi:O-antigen ligase family protein [Ferriphaselus sp. R-1]|uniref:O-antigen ligase family protein n=1 Tax=Ferriphaselus sp. R-1 TaxID=1485544 RepID=UPI000556FCE2|nr:O-antigen ligase family protein [Ferriphaselus sp. R-1]
MSAAIESLPLTLQRTAQWLAVALAFTLPQQVALNNLVLGLLLLVALPAYGKDLPELIRQNPVARVAVIMFGLLLLGTLWGDAPWGQALGVLGKYVDLALIPLFMLLFREPVTRARSLRAFIFIMLIAWALSWAIGLRLLPLTHGVRFLVGPSAQVDNPSIFHSYITQGLMTPYASFLLLLWARQIDSARLRWAMYLLAAQAVADVLLMLNGRTGYLTLLVLLGWLGWTGLNSLILRHGLGVRGKLAAYAALILFPLALMMSAYQGIPRVHDRVTTALTEVQQWQPGKFDEENSMGTRLSLYANSLTLIADKPLLGYGTGGLARAYGQLPDVDPTHLVENPHNEYLMQAVQLGFLGPVMLIYLFVTLWRCAARLPAFERDAARGLVLTYSLTSVFNSMLLDHTEGLFFAFFTAWLFARLGEPEAPGRA